MGTPGTRPRAGDRPPTSTRAKPTDFGADGASDAPAVGISLVRPGARPAHPMRWLRAVLAAAFAALTGRAGQPRLVALIALGAVALVLGSFAVWAGGSVYDLRDGVAVDNAAVTDVAGTREVTAQITDAVNTIFSYNYADLGSTQRRAQEVITGQAIGQYNDLFALVAQQAPEQRLVVTVTVVACGVEVLQGDRARLLVFADQTDTRNADRQTSHVGAQFAVEARRENGRWKIAEIDAFTGN